MFPRLDKTTMSLRRRIIVQGIVQGVGFRPFVYGQARRFHLTGFILNDSQGVTIEVEGAEQALDCFQRALLTELPPLARIDTIQSEPIPSCDDDDFVIVHSRTGAERQALISPDTSICADCLRELFDPTDRRYHYPFINCTNCGPRFTIIQDVPYDREKTTMSVFPMCPDCQAEYEDPLNRRFHAQPNACPVCGPQVRLLDSTGLVIEETDPIAAAAHQLAAGAILAIKGLGGYHLACDALNAEAVRCLRQRKHREAKPFALMVPDLETAQRLCLVNTAESQLLLSHHRPIVLLNRRDDYPVATDVAPLHTTLGIMLPYTPLHYLLLAAYAKLVAPGCPAALVMTSGNLSDGPIAYQDEDALERLGTIADGFLLHNRTIYMRCDDSVMRIVAGGEQFLRRSRGYAPEPISLALDFPVPLLACGAHLKNTFCLAKGKRAFMGHHIGDLENLETLLSFQQGIEHFKNLFDIAPEAVAYDLHPDYLATQYALDSPIERKIGVQHHHAHIASVLAEHGLSGPVIGVAADGSGYGTDGTIWGCEIMTADLCAFERMAHLAYVPLPGGEQAVRQPWRMGAVYLAHTYGDAFLNKSLPFVRELERPTWHMLEQMMAKGINSPLTSSLGRLFDAVAAIVGVRSYVLYEGQAAIELEALATGCSDENIYPFMLTSCSPALLDVRPLIDAVVSDLERGIPAANIARRFHNSIAEMLAMACLEVRAQTGIGSVALSGGVFQNRMLLQRLVDLLEKMGLQVYTNRKVPTNDGGISLGQAAIGARRLREMPTGL
ncbi:MAG TPA: carbamoyltransferase HypF [Ktedonosporobacter sp.]|jgi:hydrogenase maturation protein HypF|nr:carbamoyltransferase HypF [Ktedonosporobacter sp.]